MTKNKPSYKFDNGKHPASCLEDFGKALEDVSMVFAYGLSKYGKRGSWRNIENGCERYRDAMWRHLLKAKDGIDSESRISHLAHAAWNILAVLELNNEKE